MKRDRVAFRGSTIDTRDAAVPHSAKARLFWGIYESAECRFVSKHLKSDVAVIELGASIGAVGSQIAQKLSPGTRYTCVEANPNLVETLSRNVECNAKHLESEVVHAAIAYGAAKVDFTVATDNRVSSLGGSSTGTKVSVKAICLRDLTSMNPYQLVCDIEGAEVALLENESDVLALCELAIIELHENEGLNHHMTIGELVNGFCQTGLKQVENYGNVYVFKR